MNIRKINQGRWKESCFFYLSKHSSGKELKKSEAKSCECFKVWVEPSLLDNYVYTKWIICDIYSTCIAVNGKALTFQDLEFTYLEEVNR